MRDESEWDEDFRDFAEDDAAWRAYEQRARRAYLETGEQAPDFDTWSGGTSADDDETQDPEETI